MYVDIPPGRSLALRVVNDSSIAFINPNKSIQILIKTLRGKTKTIASHYHERSDRLHLRIADAVQMPARCFYITHQGKILVGQSTLRMQGIQSGDTVWMHGRLQGGDGGQGQDAEDTSLVRLTVANVTHLPNALDELLSVEGDVYYIQEHSLGKEQLRGVASILRGKHLYMHASPSHQTGTNYTAGVATIARAPRPVYPISCRTHDGRELHRSGRLQITGVGIGHKQTLTIANLYGWTRGAEDLNQALRTDHLIRVAVNELTVVPDKEPCLIVGDLNADLTNLTAVQHVLSTGWKDLGALYDDSATCFASTTAKGTRRDYALANPAALQVITGFRVAREAELRTHLPLVITLRPQSGRITYIHHKRPGEILPLIRQQIKEKVRAHMASIDENASSASDSDESNDSDTPTCPDEHDDNNGENADDTDNETQHQSGPAKLSLRAKRRAATKAKAQAWQEAQQEASSAIDKRLRSVGKELDRFITDRRTADFWRTWSRAAEDGLIDYALRHSASEQADKAERRTLQGRGKPKYKTRQLQGTGAAAPDLPGWSSTSMGGTSAALRRQVRRLHQLHKRVLEAWGGMEENPPGTWKEWKSVTDSDFTRICARTLSANMALPRKDRIHNDTVLGLVQGITSCDTSHPDTYPGIADSPCRSHPYVEQKPLVTGTSGNCHKGGAGGGKGAGHTLRAIHPQKAPPPS